MYIFSLAEVGQYQFWLKIIQELSQNPWMIFSPNSQSWMIFSQNSQMIFSQYQILSDDFYPKLSDDFSLNSQMILFSQNTSLALPVSQVVARQLVAPHSNNTAELIALRISVNFCLANSSPYIGEHVHRKCDVTSASRCRFWPDWTPFLRTVAVPPPML